MAEKTCKQLPCGEQNFASIRTENYAYVDKTRYIEKLEKESNKRQFFIRPRKFGKSLFISMLSYYYDMLCADRFQELFGGLYIGDNPTPLKNSYAIMEFDFSGIDTGTPENFIKSFNGKVQLLVQRFLERYKSVFRQSDKLIDNIEKNQMGIRALEIAYSAAMATGVKIFVIIDEYDHFANDLIAMGVNDVYKKILLLSVRNDALHVNGLFLNLFHYLLTFVPFLSSLPYL